MTNEDKKYLIEKVGLCWHDWPALRAGDCRKCDADYEVTNIQLDPLDPADLYGKIWPAMRTGKEYMGFGEVISGWSTCDIVEVFSSAPDLAQAMLEYFKEKDNGKR